MTAIKKPVGLAQSMLNKGRITRAQFYTWERLARDGYAAGMAGNPKTTHYDRSYVDGGPAESDYAMQRRQIVNTIILSCGRTGGAVLDYVCIKGVSLKEASTRLEDCNNPHQAAGILKGALDVAANVYRELQN